MGIQPLATTSSGSILKLFITPIILYQFQKDPFCLIILYVWYMYFVLFHTCIYIAPGQVETTLGDNCFDGSRKGLSL